jgi:hypothetical protein
MTMAARHPASYKDPAGFVFASNGQYYRQVNQVYAPDYDLLMQSGLYQQLVNQGWLLPHTETADPAPEAESGAYKILLPQQLPFISYATEWSFGQLKAAALLTLRIMQAAMQKGMILKDATPYNVQFVKGSAVFIDTLSFEKYDEAKPWVAYRQFCETFLYPPLIEYYTGMPVHKTAVAYPDGIPAAIAARLLPRRTRFKMSVWMHVFLPASVAARQQPTNTKPARAAAFNRRKMDNLISHLLLVTEKLTMKPQTTWSDYYTHTILGGDYLKKKTEAVRHLLGGAQYNTLLDLGCNDGVFSRLAENFARRVIAADSDAGCIHNLFLSFAAAPVVNMHPLIFDVAQPAPATGFMNRERSSALQRMQADMVLALALVHHLCVGGYLGFSDVAQLLAQLAPELVIEFVLQEDEKVQQLLRQSIRNFGWYTQPNFESAFTQHFKILQCITLIEGKRILYKMVRK